MDSALAGRHSLREVALRCLICFVGLCITAYGEEGAERLVR